MLYKIIFFIASVYVKDIYSVGLLEGCFSTSDCTVGIKPACLEVTGWRLCVEQCNAGVESIQCGGTRACNSNSTDADGSVISSCVTEDINCVSSDECSGGEICSPYSLACIPPIKSTTLLLTTTTAGPLTSTNSVDNTLTPVGITTVNPYSSTKVSDKTTTSIETTSTNPKSSPGTCHKKCIDPKSFKEHQCSKMGDSCKKRYSGKFMRQHCVKNCGFCKKH
uniref:ShKT domain-containing protein n=1 Tax=Parastrongyloides trichosuri TaxID=131310 RepID=A0A0N4ZKY2_PARTI